MDQHCQIRELPAGAFFGERALLFNEPRSATITAVVWGNQKWLFQMDGNDPGPYFSTTNKVDPPPITDFSTWTPSTGAARPPNGRWTTRAELPTWEEKLEGDD